jgi:cell volume regulation protein A
VSVLLCLAPFKFDAQKKAMISWVGLRGSVPIILATFPFMAGIPQADTIFNIVFFIVITSVLIQGTSIPAIARVLKLDAPWTDRTSHPLEFEKTEGIEAELADIPVPYDSGAAGRMIRDLSVPEKCLIVLISRDNHYIVPSGTTIVKGGDILQVLANAEDLSIVRETMARSQGEAQA